MTLLRYRPSAAHRWLQCTGYPRVANAAETWGDPPAPYADEGRLAHAQLATLITGGECADASSAVRAAAESVLVYRDLIGGELYSEILLSVPDLGTDVTGTLDVVIVTDTSVTIIDYKNGVGIPVSAVDNPQLGLYALAARQRWPGRGISLAVLQPRSAVGETLDFWSPSDYWLDEQADSARRAIAAPAQYVIGDHCRLCPGLRGFCPAQIERLGDLACEATPPWWLLDAAPVIRALLDGVREQACTVLRSGGAVPGYTLECHEGGRRWANPATAASDLAALCGGDPAQYTRSVPIGVGDAEKIAKKRSVEKLVEITGGSITSWRQKKKLEKIYLSLDEKLNSTIQGMAEAGNTIDISGLTERGIIEKLVKSGNSEVPEDAQFCAIE